MSRRPHNSGLFDIAFTVKGIPRAGSDPVTSDPLPQYASALEKQFGLKLEPVKGPRGIVIDSVRNRRRIDRGLAPEFSLRNTLDCTALNCTARSTPSKPESGSIPSLGFLEVFAG
jgi:hypothetical protein